MKVYLKKDIPRTGLQGEIIEVADGFAHNYLIPKNLVVQVTEGNETFFKSRKRTIEHRKEVIASESSMLAEKIKSLELVVKKTVHDNGKLYGALSAQDIIQALAQKGIKVSKSQVIFDKSIKQTGSHFVTIKLSSRLQPQVKVTVVAE